MSYNVKSIPNFDRQAKRLSRKYDSFKSELSVLVNSLSTNPNQGSSLGNDCYKIRMAIKSKGQGKRSGARIITHIIAVKDDIYLLTVFDKSEKENISDKELQGYLQQIL